MLFEECFRKQYALIHRLETNKVRLVTAALKLWHHRTQEAAPVTAEVMRLRLSNASLIL